VDNRSGAGRTPNRPNAANYVRELLSKGLPA
jgi:hypothetical protein